MVFAFAFRGVVSNHFLSLTSFMLAALFHRADKTDQTADLFSSGPSLLTMEHFVPLSTILMISLIAACVVAESALALSSMWMSIPICLAFNYMMEQNERRFFALWEALCSGEKIERLRRVRCGIMNLEKQ
ncbi:hypothetical protein BC829DRAFT_401482 [Chytridium lagenaria]|nr:hypothetical protein BC829DRAFT_401482 [Chytridium lagenaria]